MILLDESDSLEVLLAGAITTNQAVIYAAYVDVATDGTTFAPGSASGATNNTTAVTVAAAPAADKVRQLKFLSLYNADTAAMTATLRVVDNATNRILVKVALASGERLEYTDGQGFRVLSATGAIRSEGGSSSGSETRSVSTVTSSSGTLTLNMGGTSKAVFKTTLSENVSLTISNLPGAGLYAEYELHITQDGTGSRTFAIPASHKALGGSDTSIASAASAVTILTASTVDNGTTWRYAMQESA